MTLNERQLSTSQPVSHATRVNSSSPANAVNVQPPVNSTTTTTNSTTTTVTAAPAADKVKVVFPLSEWFDAHVACHVCYADGKALVVAPHNCRQDVLVVQSRQTGEWFRIRERINHLSFAGRYHMCNQLPNYVIGKRCPRGDSCTFAHSYVERELWMAEKLGEFDIRAFISQTGSTSEVCLLYTSPSPRDS